VGADLVPPVEAGALRSPWDEINRRMDVKPRGADWFVRLEGVTLLAQAVKTEITAYVIPNGCHGVLRWFGTSVGNVSDYPAVTFALEIDGAPLSGFASINGPISPQIANPRPLMEFVGPGQRIRVVGSNSTAASVANVLAHIIGWYWPVEASRQAT
jgi:hypothetical protein